MKAQIDLDKFLSAFSTMLYGGPSDPPDHCYWAGTGFLASITLEDKPSAQQLESLEDYKKICATEGACNEDDDEEADEDEE